MLALGDVGRALEHQVLEEVRQAGAPGLLVPRAHPVPDVHGGQRYDVVLADHHAQAIAERVLMQRLFCHGALPSGRWSVVDDSPARVGGTGHGGGLDLLFTVPGRAGRGDGSDRGGGRPCRAPRGSRMRP
ncbi:hypothetical protein Acsp04_46360 [Actinomadura sp. NBRC 104425]|nr:hypothetical protein Acsp04_46360 [Actinomadura sp. NBRC 104425]